jgi:ProP effector
MSSSPSAAPIRRPPNPVLATLVASFSVFRDVQPLAIGIHKSIKARLPDISDAPLRLALKAHTASTKYLKALASGEKRFDLDGNPAGEVTPEQRQQALDTIKDRFRKAAERKKAEQQEKERQEKLQKLAEKFNQR